MIPLLKMISNAFIALFIVTLLVFLQPWVALGTAGVLGSCYAVILLVSRKYLAHFGQQRYLATGQRYRIAQEATGGIKDVKLLGLEDVYVRRFQVTLAAERPRQHLPQRGRRSRRATCCRAWPSAACC